MTIRAATCSPTSASAPATHRWPCRVDSAKNPPGTNNQVGSYWPSTSVVQLNPPADIADCEAGIRDAAGLDMSLLPVDPARLSGSIFEGAVDANGQVQPTTTPIPGAVARLSGVGAVEAQADGSFVFRDGVTGAEEIRLGTDNAPLDGTLSVSRNVAPPEVSYWPASFPTGELVPGGDYSINTYLVKQCTATLDIQVVDAADGAPLPESACRINSLDPEFATSQTQATGADGVFSGRCCSGTTTCPARWRSMLRSMGTSGSTTSRPRCCRADRR